MKDDVDLIERDGNCLTIAQVAFNEFHVVPYPCRLYAPVRLRLQIIEGSDLPPFAHEQIRDVRTYQAGTPCDERAFCHASVVEALAAASKSGSPVTENSERIGRRAAAATRARFYRSLRAR